MNQKQFRILAIAPSTRGFGFVVMEEEKALIARGVKTVENETKNVQSLTKAGQLMDFYQPDVLVLQDMEAKGTRHVPRIKVLQRQIIKAAGKHKIKVTLYSGKQLRTLLLGNEEGTKHEMAQKLASEFPDELAPRLPPKRRFWESQDRRMDIFDAAALAVAFLTKK